MDEQFYIRPTVEGARLADPRNGDTLKAEGEWKPRTPHWIRAENRGDVEQCEPPAEAVEEPAAPEMAVVETSLPVEAPVVEVPVTEVAAAPMPVAAEPEPVVAEPAAETAPDAPAGQTASTKSAISLGRNR